jgi:hypothetical protein
LLTADVSESENRNGPSPLPHSCSESVAARYPYPMFESGGLLNRGTKLERFKLTNMAPVGAFRVSAVEAVGCNS